MNEILNRIIDTRTNVIVEGELSSGKTSNVLFPITEEIIEKKESMLIVDSKEEYINKYYDILKANNYNVIILNLKDMNKSESWNPLEYPYKLYKNGEKEKAKEYLEKLGKSIFYDKTLQDPFWTNSASNLFVGLTLALFEDGNEDEITLFNVNYMHTAYYKKYGMHDYLYEYFKGKDSTSTAYVLASSIVFAPDETKGSIISVARTYLEKYATGEELSQLLNKTTIDYEKILNTQTAIIAIASDDNKTLNNVIALFIEQLYSILSDKKISNNFNFILDNFDVISHCNNLVDILGSCISKNMKFFIGTRSLDLLKNTYGEYIINLCSLYKIKNDKVVISINKVEEEYNKGFSEVTITPAMIDYPKLNEDPIKLFDIVEHVKKMKGIEITKPRASTNNNMDKLIKEIDSKITELEVETKNKQNTIKETNNIDDIIKKIDSKIAELEVEEKNIREKMNKEPINNIKYTYFISNPGLRHIGMIHSVSVSLTRKLDSIERVLEYRFDDIDGIIKTKTFTKAIDDKEILKNIAALKLHELKNNYYTHEFPNTYIHWELEYNKYFKIVGTDDQRPLEVSKIINYINFNYLYEQVKKKVAEDTKNA